MLGHKGVAFAFGHKKGSQAAGRRVFVLNIEEGVFFID